MISLRFSVFLRWVAAAAAAALLAVGTSIGGPAGSGPAGSDAGDRAASTSASAPLTATSTPAPAEVQIRGTAFLGRHQPVVGANVAVSRQDGSGPVILTSTGGDGVFRLEGLDDGVYRVVLDRDDLKPVVKEGVVVRHPFRAIVEVRMEPGQGAAFSVVSAPGGTVPASAPAAGGLEGVVLTADQRTPLDGARVRVVREGGGAEPRFAVTGGDGAFRIEGLPVGTWRIEVRGVGYLPLRARLDLAGSARLRVVMVPQPAGYSPQVLDLLPPEEPIPPPAPSPPAPATSSAPAPPA